MANNRTPNMSTDSEFTETVKKGKDTIIQVYEMLPNYCLKEDVPELLTGLRELMKSYVQLETKFGDLKSAGHTVNQDLMKSITDNQELPTQDEINEILKNTLSKKMENYSEVNWETDPAYRSLKDFEDEEEDTADQEFEDGEDLAVTGMSIQTIDPYTKKEFVDPVKNVRCNHSYEKATINELIATRQIKCYYMGCNNRVHIKVQDLVPDEDLKRHMTRIRARAT